MKKCLVITSVVCACLNSALAKNIDPNVKQYNDAEVYYDEDYINYERTGGIHGSYEPEKNSVRGYLGIGFLGQAVSEKVYVSDIEIASADISGMGLNLNGGVRGKHFRVGADITSTTLEGDLHGYSSTFDVSVVKYSIELAGIIKCGEHFDLELGGTIGRARFQGEGGNWSDWMTPYGLILGGTINFNAHHALTIALKGYGYSYDGDYYEEKGSVGEFVVGYRYSF